MNDCTFCLVRSETTEVYATAAAGCRGPLTDYHQTPRRLRLPFARERDVEMAVEHEEVRLELKRQAFNVCIILKDVVRDSVSSLAPFWLSLYFTFRKMTNPPCLLYSRYVYTFSPGLRDKLSFTRHLMSSLFTADVKTRLMAVNCNWAARPPRVVILGRQMFRVHPRLNPMMR